MPDTLTMSPSKKNLEFPKLQYARSERMPFDRVVDIVQQWTNPKVEPPI